jgi:predicted transcriptional regulator
MVLNREGLVRSVSKGPRRLFYPTDVQVPRDGVGLHAIQERILVAVREQPGMSVTDLAEGLDVSRQVVLYHARKLVRADLARLERQRARLRVFPTEPASPHGAAAPRQLH